MWVPKDRCGRRRTTSGRTTDPRSGSIPPPLKRPADFCRRSGSKPVFGQKSFSTVSGCLCKLVYLSLLMLQLACRRDDKSVWERLPPSQPTWLGQHCFRTRKLDQQFELFVRIVDPRQRITRRVGQAWYVRDQPWPACRLTQIQRKFSCDQVQSRRSRFEVGKQRQCTTLSFQIRRNTGVCCQGTAHCLNAMSPVSASHTCCP